MASADMLNGRAEFWAAALELIAQPRSLSESLGAMAGLISECFDADLCAIFLLEPRSDKLLLEACVGQGAVKGGRLRVGQGISGLAVFHNKTIQVAHMAMDPRAVFLFGEEPSDNSVVAVPFGRGEDLSGVFNLQSRPGRCFVPGEIAMLEGEVGSSIRTLVSAVQTFENMNRRTGELQALNELGQAMNSGLGLDESLELIASLAAEALRAKGSAVRLLVEDGTLALATVVTETDNSFDLLYEQRIAEYVAASGEPIMIDDVRASRDPQAMGSSLACVPLVLEERVVGTLTLFDKIVPLGTERRLFSIDDLDILFALSSQIAAEIEDIRLTGRLQELVRTEKHQASQLRALYSRSQAFLQSISDALLAVDRDGFVEEINTVGLRILGVEAKKTPQIHIDELVEDKPPLREWLDTGGQFSNRVVTLNTASGKVAAMANLQPIMEGTTGAAGAVLTFREMGEVGRLVNRVIGVQRTYSFEDIIGQSAIMHKTVELARIAASTSSNILIQGETGTGKEVFAQAVHSASAYSEGPFLAVNCAALPRDLIESELFGYVEGAFTGASKKGRLGKFELASGGTLFLDEIGEMPADVQVKLLRVLQEKAIVRVGGDRTIPINCRLIAATNRDLPQAVAEGRFRSDLLYRLNVITIEIPALNERREDIPLFIRRFVHIFAERNGKVVVGVDEPTINKMSQFDWPGNVRELENAVEHAVALVQGRTITVEDLPPHLNAFINDIDGNDRAMTTFERAQQQADEAQRQLYLEALRGGEGDIQKAANLMEMSRATFYRRLKQFDLNREASNMRYEYHN
jgi:transcriptional regulator with PAS, ATPase and Fis domain/putative methionine-R-sulfoxide reductase with GAF domain